MFLQENSGGGPSLSDAFGELKSSFVGLQDKLFDYEDQVARINRSVLGQGALYAENMRKQFALATIDVTEIGGNLNDVANTFGAINKILQSNTMLSSEQLTSFVAIQKSAGITAEEMATLVESFDTLGIGLDDTITSIDAMSTKARNLGLNVGTFLNTVGKNLKLVNAYNYKDGVEGFTRMVARAQALRIDMASVNKLAESLLNPEKAVELAAEFQNLGGAIGDLGNPLRLMDMAQNDMEGLQNSIIDVAKSSVMFNKETGKFQISATEMRRLRGVADALGMSYEDLANTATKAAQEQKAMDELRFTNLTDEQKQLVSNLAQVGKNGQMQITLPNGELMDISELTSTKIGEFTEQLKEQDATNKLDSFGVAKKQLSTLEQILVTLREPATKLTGNIAAGTGYTQATQTTKSFFDNLGAKMDEVLTNQNFEQGINKLYGKFDSYISTITTNQGIDEFVNTLQHTISRGVRDAVDFITSGSTLPRIPTNIPNIPNPLNPNNTNPNNTNPNNTNTTPQPVVPNPNPAPTPVTPNPPPTTTQNINLSNLNVIHTGSIRLDGITQVVDVSRMSNDDIRILSERVKEILEPELLGN